MKAQDGTRHDPRISRAVLRKMQADYDFDGLGPSLTAEEWRECQTYCEWTDEQFLRRELAAAVRLGMLGKALEAGTAVPPEALQWLGRALVQIARGADAETVLGLWHGKGRPPKREATKRKAATMAYLVHHGMNQDEAAGKLAESMPRFHRKGVLETRDLKQAHNDLKARRGVFEPVKGVEVIEDAVRLTLHHGRPTTFYMDRAAALLPRKK
jgi:hypothetical protein